MENFWSIGQWTNREKLLQFGHGVEAVENGLSIHLAQHHNDELQFGHGVEAVENKVRRPVSPRDIPLQFGHGVEAVENAIGRRPRASPMSSFNSATALKPWRTVNVIQLSPAELVASIRPRR